MDVSNNAQPGPDTNRWAKRGVGCLIIILLIPIVYYGFYILMRGPLPSTPQLIAHRGGPVYAPENTLAAFQNAIESGADFLEFDVQRTKDGVLVVIHDETVDRTTDGSGKVGDLTLEQIRALDAGNGEQVPTFDEVIALAKNAGVGLMPEAKSPELYPGMEAEMITALLAGNMLDQAVIQSFEPDALEKLQQADPDASLCALYGLWELNPGSTQPGEAEAICPMAEMAILNPWMIRQAHQNGKDVFVWFGVLEHPLVMQLLLAFGADGVMVDDPIALAEILDR